MSTINIDSRVHISPQFKRLARTLKISKPQAMGHLCLLWSWCNEFVKDGDLGQYQDIEIAEAAEWEDDPNMFCTALRETQFIFTDENDPALAILSDWELIYTDS